MSPSLVLPIIMVILDFNKYNHTNILVLFLFQISATTAKVNHHLRVLKKYIRISLEIGYISFVRPILDLLLCPV